MTHTRGGLSCKRKWHMAASSGCDLCFLLPSIRTQPWLLLPGAGTPADDSLGQGHLSKGQDLVQLSPPLHYTAPRKWRGDSERVMAITYLWNNHCQFGVQGMINFADSPFIAPERVVVLSILCAGVSGGGEDLVPEGCIHIRLWHAVRWLPVEQHAQLYIQHRFCGFTKAPHTAPSQNLAHEH